VIDLIPRFLIGRPRIGEMHHTVALCICENKCRGISFLFEQMLMDPSPSTPSPNADSDDSATDGVDAAGKAALAGRAVGEGGCERRSGRLQLLPEQVLDGQRGRLP
jgi:hypothetical protein